MRQQIRNTENRIRCILTDGHRNLCTVLLDDNTVHCKRNSCPLVFFDAAVIMGFKECKLLILIKRRLLQVQTRCINMCGSQSNTRIELLFADDRSNHCFSAVCHINPVARFQLFTACPCVKAVFFEQPDRTIYCFPFGLCTIQKCLIGFTECIAFFDLRVIQNQCCVFPFQKQLLLQFFHFLFGFILFLCHIYTS